MIKLSFSVLLLLLSLLTVFKAPTYHLWLAAIIVDEFPWATVLLTLSFLLFNIVNSEFNILNNIISLFALILFLSPVYRALSLSLHLPQELKNAFGQSKSKAFLVQPAFRINAMFASQKRITPVSYTYSAIGNQNLSLDRYTSTSEGQRPCVIVVHGGSWKSGDNKQLPELNSYLAQNGYHVAAINYRLAPGSKSPAAVEDVRAAITFLKTKAAEWRIDTSQFILLGRSAGAQIALMASYTLNDPGIRGVIDFYGPTDMVWGYSIPSNPLIMNSRKVMEDYLGGTYKEKPDNFLLSSPLLHVTDKSPPTLIIHGEKDVLVAYEHSIRLSNKLHQHSVKSYFLTIPWATHGFDYNLNGPGGQLSTYAVRYFLDQITK